MANITAIVGDEDLDLSELTVGNMSDKLKAKGSLLSPLIINFLVKVILKKVGTGITSNP